MFKLNLDLDYKLFYGVILEKDNYYFYIKYGLGKYKEKTFEKRF